MENGGRARPVPTGGFPVFPPEVMSQTHNQFIPKQRGPHQQNFALNLDQLPPTGPAMENYNPNFSNPKTGVHKHESVAVEFGRYPAEYYDQKVDPHMQHFFQCGNSSQGHQAYSTKGKFQNHNKMGRRRELESSGSSSKYSSSDICDSDSSDERPPRRQKHASIGSGMRNINIRADEKKRVKNSGKYAEVKVKESESDSEDDLLPKCRPKKVEEVAPQERKPVAPPREMAPPQAPLQPRGTPNYIKEMGQLKALGNCNFKKISRRLPMFKVIKTYAQNGITPQLPQWTANIHGIYELIPPGSSARKDKPAGIPSPHDHCPRSGGTIPGFNEPAASGDTEFPDDASSTSSTPPPVGRTTTEPRILLWSKATPKGVLSRLQKRDGCMAFYEGSSRALALPPSKLTGAFRQILLLVSVSLGKMETSIEGYEYWSRQSRPSAGYNSVQLWGKLHPYSEASKEIDKIQIPCGNMIERRNSGRCSTDYSEYFVFEGNRVNIEYAVDIELLPPGVDNPKDFSDNENPKDFSDADV